MTKLNSPPDAIILWGRSATLWVDAQLWSPSQKVDEIISPRNHCEDIQWWDYVFVTRSQWWKTIVQIRNITEIPWSQDVYGLNAVLSNWKQVGAHIKADRLQKIKEWDIVIFEDGRTKVQKKISQLQPNFMAIIWDFWEDSMEIPLEMIRPLPVFQAEDEILVPRRNLSFTLAKVHSIDYSTWELIAKWVENWENAHKEVKIWFVKKHTGDT